jgi:uncharacterized membrane protein
MTEIAQVDLFNPVKVQELVADVLQEAKKQGATSAEVDVAVNKGFTVGSAVVQPACLMCVLKR